MRVAGPYKLTILQHNISLVIICNTNIDSKEDSSYTKTKNFEFQARFYTCK